VTGDAGRDAGARAAAPRLSVVLGTTQGWPDVAPCLLRLAPQADAIDAEILVADGSAAPPPPAGRLGPRVRWLRRPGAGIFELRQIATAETRAEIVAVTEDHCLPAADWCARILDACRRHPDAAAVKGAVVNGTAARLVDRAAFLLNQAPHLPPFVGRAEDDVLGVSCVAYRRAALAEVAARGEPWPPEMRDPRAWRREGARLVADATIRVAHHQSVPLHGMSALQYHNGRSAAGTRRARMETRDWVRVLAAPVLPVTRAARTAGLCLAKGVPATTVLSCLPLFLWFNLWKAAGELTGYLAGPGDSPRRLL
jgi:hypothetical protein